MPSDDKISRRRLLAHLPDLFRKRAADFATRVTDSIEAVRPAEPAEPAAPAAPALPVLPGYGAPLEGIPYVHPWIGIAQSIGERLKHRVPYVLLLGASGEAFRLSWPADPPAACPVNPFLGALAISGLTATATHGGPFEPALGGVEVSVGKGLTTVAGLASGPAVVLGVDRKAGAVRRFHGRDGEGSAPLAEFETDWERGRWSAGPAPFLRLTVEAAGPPKPLDVIARVGLETMLTLLTTEGVEGEARGLAAYDAWAGALRANSIDPETAEILHGEWLTTTLVGRSAAGSFLEAIARALPPDRRPEIEAAAARYRQIHHPAPTGDLLGTGLLPEVAECLATDGASDPDKLGNPKLRERAAGLIDEVREHEANAVERIGSLPEEWRTLRAPEA